MTQIQEELAPPDVASVDQCVVLRAVPWAQYEALLDARGEKSRPSMVYLQGTLSIMAPSPEHDSISRMFDKLLTVYALELGLDLRSFGAWTLKRAPDRGAEPYESYVLGERSRDVPDLAVEVVWTADLGGKLEVYRDLGVPEVWVWQHGRIGVHVLRDGAYVVGSRSGLLPDLDLGLLARLVSRPDQLAALRELRATLRSG